MNYGVAETEIAERITSFIESKGKSSLYEACVFPDSNKTYEDFLHNFTKARVSVEMIEVLPEPANGIGFISQNETVRFRTIFEARKLRGEGGVYDLQELVKWALVGWRLSDSINKLTISRYGLLEFEQNRIQPYMEFECKAVNVQSFQDIFPGDEPLSQNNGIQVFTQEFDSHQVS